MNRRDVLDQDVIASEIVHEIKHKMEMLMNQMRVMALVMMQIEVETLKMEDEDVSSNEISNAHVNQASFSTFSTLF